ncbi:hypothetical protein D3C73_651020 [compost metagenome]
MQLTDKDDAYVIKNLYPLYLYDLSGHYDRLPNLHGIYEESDDFSKWDTGGVYPNSNPATL